MLLAVIVPVKSFTLAKGRLAGTLTDGEREDLARSCAEHVVAAARPHTVYVVCDDPEIEQWARSHGARTVRQVSPGLNGAVHDGWIAAKDAGFDHVIVAHADLPLATSLDHVAHEGFVTIVPDRHNDGTNVLSMPADCDLVLHYGPGSFFAHLEEVVARDIPHRVIHDDDLALDLDTADDLGELTRRRTS